MKERPILFSAPMVTAILEGYKTQTRRVMRRQPDAVEYFRSGVITTDTDAQNAILRCYNNPKGFKKCASGWLASATYKTPFSEFNVGDCLWVRETFRLYDSDECPHADFPCGCPRNGTPLFKASHDCRDGEKWTPSIHMPRWASRILLEITGIRVERLQSISDEDAKAEGFDYSTHPSAIEMGYAIGAKTNFRHTWEQIYGENAWNKNPWVWVVEFKKLNEVVA
ncbi:hypothetical protein [Acinetobacter sp. UBA6720]|uniref:hypothetical protein n=1 Tax=Acinetobacter sp. UBA6720 TaxID=1945953 RepID=UPI0025BE01B3|nr:hypothetical protein [Acinetobacter sp. UBA6720]